MSDWPHLPIDRSNNFLSSHFGGYVSLSIVVIRSVVDKTCAECVSQGLSARRSNHQADWMNELSFHWSMRYTSYVFVVLSLPFPLSNYLVSVYHLVFHRFHTFLLRTFIRTSHYLSIPRWHEILTFTIYVKKCMEKIQISQNTIFWNSCDKN